VRSIASLTLWLFVIGTSLILGAGLYEALVVVPFWSAGAPASLAEGNPLLQVHVRAGHVFWQYFTPVVCPMFCTSWIVSVAQRVLLISRRSRGCGEVGSVPCFPLLHTRF
jgi:hypothetical protein